MSTIDVSYLLNQIFNGDDDVLNCALEKLQDILDNGSYEDICVLKVRSGEVVKTIINLFFRMDQQIDNEDNAEFKKELDHNFYGFL